MSGHQTEGPCEQVCRKHLGLKNDGVLVIPSPIKVAANGIDINVAQAGDGPALLLLHGWPHNWYLWAPLIPRLTKRFRVIAPDMRGIGGSTKAESGYDLHSLSDDMAALLDALGIESLAAAVGIDAGMPVAWMLGMRHAESVKRLVLMEGLLGALPGAEAFLSRGAPWWFGFHAIPGFAENLLAGREAAYLEFFYRSGTFGGKGVRPDALEQFVAAYSQADGMRCGFEYYRAMPENARQIASMVATRRVIQPTLAIGGNTVGAALHGQLAAICDDLSGTIIPDCGHIIPQDEPDALAALIEEFVAD